MVTKHGRMVIFLDGFLLIKSHDPLIKWPCKFMWQTETIVSLLPWQTWQGADMQLISPVDEVT